MSIQSEIDRIENNIAATYSELEEQGATMPSARNSTNLAATAATTKTVKYIAQTLTDAQKAQARTNIGAVSEAELPNAFYVTVEGADGVYSVDKTMAEIIAAYISGKPIYCVCTYNENGMSAENVIMPLIILSEGTAVFGVFVDVAIMVAIADGMAMVIPQSVVTEDALQEYLANLVSYNVQDKAANQKATARENINAAGRFYGVCSTAAGTVAKTVTVDDSFSLEEGVQITVKFTNANSASSPTLNVNGKGAKPIYRYGTTVVSTGTTTTGWVAGAIQTFTYDGTGWIRDYWSNTTYSNVSLGQGYATCSTAAATVAKTATLSSYALTTGGIVAVKFTNDVPAGATLNINSKGAKAMYYKGAAITADIIKAGDTATFIYNGTYYHLLSIDRDSEAVLYTEQELTKDQQYQARKNINAVTADLFTTTEVVTPDYTNQISLSTDVDGNLIGGNGLIAGKTVNSNGAISDNAGTFVTGFIPVKKGDVIRIRDIGLTGGFPVTSTFALYKTRTEEAASSDVGKNATNIGGNAAYGQITIDGLVATWDTTNISYYNWNNFAYLRATIFNADAVITINEEITESVKEGLILTPAVKVTEESLTFDIAPSPLSGKKIVCFGDSLFGMHRDSSSTPSNVAIATGAEVHNVGFGGCRMSVHPTAGYAAFSMWALAKAIAENNWTTQDAQASSGSSYFPEQLALLKSIDFNEVDIAVIHYGTNDFDSGNGIPLDNANDHDDYNTLCGALRYSVEKLLSAYPKLRIYVSLPVYRYWESNGVTTYAETYLNKIGKTLPEFVEGLRNTAAEYNLPVIDGYYGLGVNKTNASTFLSDGTHHNVAGRERFGSFIGANLIAQQTTAKSGSDSYSKTEIDAMLGSYINDIDTLVGGGF